MEEFQGENQEEQIIDPVKLVKKVHKSRKLRHGRKKQTTLRKTFRFFMTIFLIFALVYISKMPQWYLDKNAYTTVKNNTIIIENNKIVKPHRILAFLKLHKVPEKPIYMMKTAGLERDIKKLPPVKDVYIRRYAFPARLQIIIKERIPIISIAPSETLPPVAAYTKDGILIGHEYMPLAPDIKTIRVLSYGNKGDDYKKWDINKINEIEKIVKYVSLYSKEQVEYLDLRNPNDVYVKIKTVNIRLGKIDGGVYERIKRIPSILPQVKLTDAKVKYLDLSWEKVNYLKLE